MELDYMIAGRTNGGPELRRPSTLMFVRLRAETETVFTSTSSFSSAKTTSTNFAPSEAMSRGRSSNQLRRVTEGMIIPSEDDDESGRTASRNDDTTKEGGKENGVEEGGAQEREKKNEDGDGGGAEEGVKKEEVESEGGAASETKDLELGGGAQSS